MLYTNLAAEVAIKTATDLTRDGLDHYGIAPGLGGAIALSQGLQDREATRATVDLLEAVASATSASAWPHTTRSGGLLSGPRLTRIVVHLAGGSLLLLAIRGWLTDAAARQLANVIEQTLWDRPSHHPFLSGPPRYLPIYNDGKASTSTLETGLTSRMHYSFRCGGYRPRLF